MASVMTFAEAENHLHDPYSCFKLMTTKKHIALSPKYIGNVKTGILELLNSEVGRYSDKLEGVLVAFRNVTQLQPRGTIITSQPFIHFDIQAELIIFQPSVGSFLKGTVNKIGRDYVGCLVHGSYNASIPRPCGEEGRSWIGSKLTMGQEFVFEVTMIQPHFSMISIGGKLTQTSIGSQMRGQKRRHSSVAEECQTVDDSSQTESLPDISFKRKKRKRDKGEASVRKDTLPQDGDSDQLASPDKQFSVPLDAEVPSTSGHKANKKKSKHSRCNTAENPIPSSSHGVGHHESEGGSGLSDADSGIGIVTPVSNSEPEPAKRKKHKKHKS